jgi:multidrug efflux pump
VIVGGLLVGTLFTLFVIPVVYTYLASRTVKQATQAEEEALAAAIVVPKPKRLQAAE